MPQSASRLLQAGDPAPDIAVLRHDESSVQLASCWAERPTFLIFTRHFG